MRRGDAIPVLDDMLTVGKIKRRLHWSLWAVDKQPLGFVTFGPADEAGAKYVASYCLKDQFSAEKAEGTGREAKSENFATGLFRMSKRPAIGEAWLMQKLERLDRADAVLPNTHLRVPGLSGYWYPSGAMREKLLWGFRAIYQRLAWRGLEPPQWQGLVEACKGNPSDLEILTYAQDDEENRTSIEADIARKARWLGGEARARKEAAFRRDYAALCDPCLKASGRGVYAYRDSDLDIWRFKTQDGARAFGKEFILENRGSLARCEGCGEAREVWAVARD